MRWWSIPILAALGWFAFTLTPLWALYDLARAVQAGDIGYVESHVNFRTLRVSLTRQLTAAIRAGGAELDPRERQKIAEAAGVLALPLAEALVTPQTVVDLLDDGWPQSADLPNPPRHDPADGLRVDRIARLAAFYTASEMRGFRTVVVAVPPDRPASEQFRIRMRLHDWSWRLVEIELTETLLARIARKAARPARPRGEQGVKGETRNETPDQPGAPPTLPALRP